MKKFLRTLMVFALVFAIMMPVVAMAAKQPGTYYVKTSTGKKLNLRNACEVTANGIFTAIPYGAAVEVFEFYENGKWAQVEYNDRVGYVLSRYLSATKPEPISTTKTSSKSDADTYAEGNPPMALDINLTSNPSTGCAWKYVCDNDAVVTVVENGYYDGEEVTLGAAGTEAFRFDGISAGWACVTFSYVTADETVLYTITYYVEVEDNLDVTLYDMVFDFN